jgi:hypothetical protein
MISLTGQFAFHARLLVVSCLESLVVASVENVGSNRWNRHGRFWLRWDEAVLLTADKSVAGLLDKDGGT